MGAYGANTYVLSGTNERTWDGGAIASQDGLHWTKIDMGLGDDQIDAICYFNKHFFAYGSKGGHAKEKIAQSTDGFKWDVSEQEAPGYIHDAVTFHNSLVLCTGEGIFASQDGLSFTPVDLQMNENDYGTIHYLIKSNGQLAAFASLDHSYGTILVTDDGKVWSKHQVDYHNNFCDAFVSQGDHFLCSRRSRNLDTH